MIRYRKRSGSLDIQILKFSGSLELLSIHEARSRLSARQVLFSLKNSQILMSIDLDQRILFGRPLPWRLE